MLAIKGYKNDFTWRSRKKKNDGREWSRFEIGCENPIHFQWKNFRLLLISVFSENSFLLLRYLFQAAYLCSFWQLTVLHFLRKQPEKFSAKEGVVPANIFSWSVANTLSLLWNGSTWGIRSWLWPAITVLAQAYVCDSFPWKLCRAATEVKGYSWPM